MLVEGRSKGWVRDCERFPVKVDDGCGGLVTIGEGTNHCT